MHTERRSELFEGMDIEALTDEQLLAEIDRATALEREHGGAGRVAHARLVRVGLEALQAEADRRRRRAS